MQSLKRGKSIGIDNIPSEIIKNGGSQMVITINLLCQKIWVKKEWPYEWVHYLIIPLKRKVTQESSTIMQLYNFVDFKKSFDRVWHVRSWKVMRYTNIYENIIEILGNLY